MGMRNLSSIKKIINFVRVVHDFLQISSQLFKNPKNMGGGEEEDKRGNGEG